ncbi:hypothetical protein CspeluHIS016_0602410 [Cutaneotrichosporon spelunceum]|uniref:Chromo domain-containing protein n=1 Tax=Cutaneotrichosporon spelunceum TaxID=1672016 RepID=A0AAD3TXS4_9TREE|nr:hypothetical protein CspeluHIS016_0602410 [Cutaneotrichosporon spelunceum]
MSDGRRRVEYSIWPKFPKGWNTWRTLKQEAQFDDEDDTVPAPTDRCARTTVVVGKSFYLVSINSRRKQKMEVEELDEEGYFIKRVIGRRAIGNVEYLIEWDGYDMDDCWWEPGELIHWDKGGGRPHVDHFLWEANEAKVNVRLPVALLPEPEIVAVWDPLTGKKRNKNGRLMDANGEGSKGDVEYTEGGNADS